MPWNIPKIRSFEGCLCENSSEWYFYIAGVLTHSFSFSHQSCWGPFLLSTASASGLPAGGRDKESSWTGQGDKAPQLQQPESAPRPDATEEDRRQTANVGWNHPWARQLLDCVGPLDRYQAEKAHERGEHGTVVCQPHRKQGTFTEIKLKIHILQMKNVFRTKFPPSAFLQHTVQGLWWLY